MYQITSGTFQAAKRYCIHDHVVAEDGPWHDMRSCWFNELYTRVLPSHAIELTAALLDRQVAQAIGSRSGVTPQRKQDLAAIIHLCGASAGQAYVSRGFRLLQRYEPTSGKSPLPNRNSLAWPHGRKLQRGSDDW
jgi:hypothetical protein